VLRGLAHNPMGLNQHSIPLVPAKAGTQSLGLVPDPAAASGNAAETALAFKDAYRMLHRRIAIFTALPIRSLDRLSLRQRLKEIGRTEGATAQALDPT